MKLEPGMKVIIPYDIYDPSLGNEGTAELIKFVSNLAPAVDLWEVIFEGAFQPVRRHIEVENVVIVSSLEQLMIEYRDAYQELLPSINRLEEMKQAVKDKAVEDGIGTAEIEGLKVRRVEGYSRTSWNGARLEGLALVHPEILECRQEKQTKPYVTVEIGK